MLTIATDRCLAWNGGRSWRWSGRPAPCAQTQPAAADGVAAFETVRQVLQHPRCQNCHIPGDAPLQFDEGRVARAEREARCRTARACAGTEVLHVPHRGEPARGLRRRTRRPARRTGTCRRREHEDGLHQDLTSAELCGVLKNKATNGNRDLPALVEHVSHDKLVLWGWAPGGARAPVSVTHEAFVAKFKTWVAAGAPCPSR